MDDDNLGNTWRMFEDPVEVVVCDGFVGNVILKTCESILGETPVAGTVLGL